MPTFKQKFPRRSCSLTHLVPSIVWWDIEAVVVDELCRNQGEKQSDQSSLSMLAPIDWINAARLGARRSVFNRCR